MMVPRVPSKTRVYRPADVNMQFCSSLQAHRWFGQELQCHRWKPCMRSAAAVQPCVSDRAIETLLLRFLVFLLLVVTCAHEAYLLWLRGLLCWVLSSSGVAGRRSAGRRVCSHSPRPPLSDAMCTCSSDESAQLEHRPSCIVSVVVPVGGRRRRRPCSGQDVAPRPVAVGQESTLHRTVSSPAPNSLCRCCCCGSLWKERWGRGW